MSIKIPRSIYAKKFGPTTGDRIRLADTELFIEVERDHTVYGEELKFGGGRVIRDGMGQSQVTRARGAVDTVITNVVILDHWGIVKADIGIKDGLIANIGKAGNPDVQPEVSIIVGPGTEVIAGEGLILTAGAVDAHANFVSPQSVVEALAAGVTSMLGGGTGPTSGSRSAPTTPGPWHLKRMIEAADSLAMNLGFAGKGSASQSDAISEQVNAGACLLTVHEDWGASPATIDCALGVADQHDVQLMLRSDTMNEGGYIEDTVAALKGRTIYALDVEGAGGGHVPDSIRLCGEPNVLPASGNIAQPYAGETTCEQLEIVFAIHHLDAEIPEDVAFAESLIRKETMAAADVLLDMGAISIIGSSCQAGGRASELILRTWQCADAMKQTRGKLPGDGVNTDNNRVKRYLAKYTINPAIAHGIAAYVGSVEQGKRADLVLWSPAFFGVKPELVMLGGMIASATVGQANSAIMAAQPLQARPMFGSIGKVAARSSVTFVSTAARENGGLVTDKALVSVRNTRRLGKKDMIHNDAMPNIQVDPETYEVRADGELLTHEPLKIVSLAQRYFLV